MKKKAKSKQTTYKQSLEKMYATPDEDYFSNFNHNKNTESILPAVELMVNFRLNGDRMKKPCILCAEKIVFKGLLQLRLTEKGDQRRVYITTLDAGSFNELKHDQSLHVTFSGFIENLARMLQDCRTGKLELALVQKQSNTADESMDYQLQFVEMRSFKNLIHLCLPSRIAPLNVVLFYMSSRLDAIQTRNQTQEHQIQSLQQEVDMHLHTIEQLNAENGKLRENLVDNTRNLNQRHSEELQHLQESLRKASEQRHLDNERSQKTITALQLQMDKLIVEKNNLQTEKIKEQKHIDVINEELVSARSQNSSLKDQIERLHAEISSMKNTERKNEMHLADARNHISELQEKFKKYDKAKADVVAELEAEKKISQTKRKALEMAAEEISKANEIILKQTQELIKLKKTIHWRTEVALQQEKAIEDKDALLQLGEKELSQARKTIETLREEIPQQLDSMRKFANTLEQKYSEQINALRDKLKSTGKENVSPHMSNTPLSAVRYK
ncbi:spindle assembly abnormal protein 6 homolog [Anastrepha ludens]|uniref:spindle assembly abnormal protein 6 homolog n=1 Tax=Anastrepha ludens TaxID=28586 RepID=UPI0023AF8888|nr:spindle assembly abnormal protein 6 homolog [Anastrepha ludens]